MLNVNRVHPHMERELGSQQGTTKDVCCIRLKKHVSMADMMHLYVFYFTARFIMSHIAAQNNVII